MEWLVKLSWALLALVHASPAAVLLRPGLTQTLYGVPPEGTTGTLLIHRGALFLAVVAVCLLAIFSPEARRAASLVTGISVAGFLLVYALANTPAGPLRTIAIADAVALLPLGLVLWNAWGRA